MPGKVRFPGKVRLTIPASLTSYPGAKGIGRQRSISINGCDLVRPAAVWYGPLRALPPYACHGCGKQTRAFFIEIVPGAGRAPPDAVAPPGPGLLAWIRDRRGFEGDCYRCGKPGFAFRDD